MSAEAILVKDVMINSRVAVKPSDSVSFAVKTLLEQNLTGIPVVDDNEVVCGFISEADCMKHLISDAYYHDQSAVVSDVMFKEPFCVSATTTLLEVANLMTGNKPKVMPVIEDGKLVGEITRHEVIKTLYQQAQ